MKDAISDAQVEWRTMADAPKGTHPIQHVRLLMEDGTVVPDAHWAYGDGDGLMPPFGPAWFTPCGSGRGYLEIPGIPVGWSPINQETDSIPN